jgi:hypothetical protein
MLMIAAYGMVGGSISAWAAVDSATPAAENPGDRMVCKYRQKTGTRFKTKICKTVDEWEALSEQSRRDANEMINRPVISIEKGN